MEIIRKLFVYLRLLFAIIIYIMSGSMASNQEEFKVFLGVSRKLRLHFHVRTYIYRQGVKRRM